MRVDSHVHIVGPAGQYPQVPERTYLAGLASVDTLQRLGATRGITRFVVVQPSFYGADNSATLDALDELAGQGRGVAVIDPAATPRDILGMFHRRGVRGLRINLYSPIKAPGGGTLEAAFAAAAEPARAMGWHLQVIAPLPVLLGNAAMLANAPVPVVIDHYGLYGDLRPGSADGRRLLDLVTLPHVWVKLSAPYRHDRGPLNTRPDRDWLAALLAAAPDRSVWGSDWPHPPPHEQQKGAALEAPYRALSYTELVDEFVAALPSIDWADRIMRDNAARLYDL
jgi:predicted TIM-barrel fold metal-dependent hydrolase